VNNVFKLITGQLAEGSKTTAASIRPGSVAEQFAEQIERSNQMKSHVTDELEAINQDARRQEPSAPDASRNDKRTPETGLIHD